MSQKVSGTNIRTENDQIHRTRPRYRVSIHAQDPEPGQYQRSACEAREAHRSARRVAGSPLPLPQAIRGTADGGRKSTMFTMRDTRACPASKTNTWSGGDGDGGHGYKSVEQLGVSL
ncbi:hypothetical protein FQA47_003495 [Oryzias melastigma]|uniref:Uncharacterized protein n=1 Tax=Oryzias melastigma TaxID=30732 RepID=A0A834C781_ORYME|nr:hypothetical protein FQA47_003495 [Oryzias melastigma]